MLQERENVLFREGTSFSVSCTRSQLRDCLEVEMKGGKYSFNSTGNHDTPIIIMVMVKLANRYLPSAKRPFVSAFLSE